METHTQRMLQTCKHIAICAGLILGAQGLLPTAMAAVSSAPAYRVETVSYQWIDATTGTKQLPGITIPIGFNLSFYGATYNNMAIWETGTLILDPSSNPSYYTAENRIKVFKDSLSLHYPTSGVYTKLEGSAPNRRLTVSWIDMAYFIPSPGCISDDCNIPPPDIFFGKGSFQATLYEGSNDIVYRYQDVVFSDEVGTPIEYRIHDNGGTATVAVENKGDTYGTLFSHQQKTIYDQTALRLFVGSPANLSPAANAGPDQTVDEGATVYLSDNGSSDPDGSISGYTWSRFYSNLPYYESSIYSNTPATSFSTLNVTADTVYTYQLTVTDNQRAYTTDRMILTVRDVATPPPNTPPTAQAGPDQTVQQNVTVTLNGSASSDPDGSITAYSWRQVSGNTVTLNNATSVTPTFTAPRTSKTISLSFELTVTDNKGATGKDQVVINVTK